MNKTLFTISLTALLSSTAMAQLEPQIHRWLLQNPASAERGDVLLQLEHDMLTEDGCINLHPFDAPKLHQLRPSQGIDHYFYVNQDALIQLQNARINSNAVPPFTYAQLRERYQQIYNIGDASQRRDAEYYLGYIDYAEGKYDSALKHFDALPADERYTTSTTFYRMQILYAQGEWELAGQAAQVFLSQPESSLSDEVDYASLQNEALRIKAECLLHAEHEDEALKVFRQWLSKVEIPVATSAYNAGVLEYYEEQWEAAANCGSLAATYATHPQLQQFAYMLVGEACLQQGETQQALMAFSQAAKITDGEPQTQEAAAYNVCAVTHSANYSLWGDEVKLLESFLNTYPTSRYADRVSEYLAEVYTTTRNYEAALVSIGKIRQPSATLLKAKQRLHHQLGVQHYLNSRWADASEQFSHSIKLGQRDVVAQAESYFWRGEANYHQGQWRNAANDYQQFIRLNPKGTQQGLMAAAYYNLGYAQMQQQDYQSAIGSFGSYITQPGERGTASYTDGLLRLADCYYYTRQFPKAEDYYHTAAISSSSQRDYAMYQEAFMMGLQKKYSTKQQQLDRLIAECPESQFIDDAWLDKGRTALLQNDAPAAIHSFQQIIERYADSPIAPQAAVELAMTYNNMGQTEAAQRIYQLVAERYPDSDAALTAAEDLHMLGVQQQLRSLPQLYDEGRYQEVLDTYRQLTTENIDFREAQTMQLVAAKAYISIGDTQNANALLAQAANELRTAAGSEAKYMLAQQAFDNVGASDEYASATQHCTELIQSGTPHQYWLARGIILMSDIMRRQGDTFTADEYLKSLQQNYNGSDDNIGQMINERLN